MDDEVMAIVVIVVIVGGGIFGAAAGLSAIGNRAAFPGHLAQVESLRVDVQRVDMAESEDVIGQVTAWNQRIAQCQAYNRIWWADFMYPDACDDVALIQVPQR